MFRLSRVRRVILSTLKLTRAIVTVVTVAVACKARLGALVSSKLRSTLVSSELLVLIASIMSIPGGAVRTVVLISN